MKLIKKLFGCKEISPANVPNLLIAPETSILEVHDLQIVKNNEYGPMYDYLKIEGFDNEGIFRRKDEFNKEKVAIVRYLIRKNKEE